TVRFRSSLMLPPDPKKLLPPKAADHTPDPGAAPPTESLPAAYGQASPPPVLSAMPGLAALLHALRRSWQWALPLAVLGGFLAAAASWLVVPGQYASMVVFRIQSRAPQGSLENEENFLNVQRAQVAILKSYEVLDETIRRSRVEEKFGVSHTPQTLAKLLV